MQARAPDDSSIARESVFGQEELVHQAVHLEEALPREPEPIAVADEETE